VWAHRLKPFFPMKNGKPQADAFDSSPSPARGPAARMRRFRPFAAAAGKESVRPNCDIGRASSGRPLPDPTADLGSLSVLAKESGRPLMPGRHPKPFTEADTRDGRADVPEGSGAPNHDALSGCAGNKN
jgi:hypothetical protein